MMDQIFEQLKYPKEWPQLGKYLYKMQSIEETWNAIQARDNQEAANVSTEELASSSTLNWEVTSLQSPGKLVTFRTYLEYH